MRQIFLSAVAPNISFQYLLLFALIPINTRRLLKITKALSVNEKPANLLFNNKYTCVYYYTWRTSV